MEEIQKIVDRMNSVVKPAMEAHVKAINSPSFKAALKARQQQMGFIQKMYNSSPWKNIVRQQLETQKIILDAYSKIDTTGLIEYRKFLKNNFYSKEDVIDTKQPSRAQTTVIEDSIEIFREEAKEKKDIETLKVIEEVKEKFDLRSGKKFVVLYSPKYELTIMGNKKIKPVSFKAPEMMNLLAELSDTNNYIKTSILKENTGYSGESAVQNAVRTLNKKFIELGFINDKAIESKQGHGYVVHRDINLIFNHNAPEY